MRQMAETTTQNKEMNQVKNTEIYAKKTVRKVGNSLGTLLDNIASNMGFAEGTAI